MASAMYSVFVFALLSASAFAAPNPLRGGGSASNPTPINSALLALFNQFPLLGQSVESIGNGLAALETVAATTLHIQDNENETGCTPMTLIFARGTTEPGNVGIVAGPPLVSALNNMLGDSTVTVQGVDYPADIDGFLAGGSATGSQTMAKMVTSAMASCPTTKLVMVGYSQGGQLVHNAAAMLPASTMAKVSSAVIFGDPDNGAAVQGLPSSRTKIICHDGDNICQLGDLILLPHLTYGLDANTAATFIATVASMGLGN